MRTTWAGRWHSDQGRPACNCHGWGSMTRSLLCATVCKKCLDQALPAMVEGLRLISQSDPLRLMEWHLDRLVNERGWDEDTFAVRRVTRGAPGHLRARISADNWVWDYECRLDSFIPREAETFVDHIEDSMYEVIGPMVEGLAAVSEHPSSSTRSGMPIAGTRLDADAVSGSWAGQSTSGSERGLERRSEAKFQPAVKPGGRVAAMQETERDRLRAKAEEVDALYEQMVQMAREAFFSEDEPGPPDPNVPKWDEWPSFQPAVKPVPKYTVKAFGDFWQEMWSDIPWAEAHPVIRGAACDALLRVTVGDERVMVEVDFDSIKDRDAYLRDIWKLRESLDPSNIPEAAERGRSRMIAALLADTTAGWGELEAERRVDWWGQCAYAMGYGLRTLVDGGMTRRDGVRPGRHVTLASFQRILKEVWGDD